MCPLSEVYLIWSLREMPSTPNIVRMIKSIRMKWARRVARMGEKSVLVGKPEGNK
jgi:hypothetical protein